MSDFLKYVKITKFQREEVWQQSRHHRYEFSEKKEKRGGEWPFESIRMKGEPHIILILLTLATIRYEEEREGNQQESETFPAPQEKKRQRDDALMRGSREARAENCSFFTFSSARRAILSRRKLIKAAEDNGKQVGREGRDASLVERKRKKSMNSTGGGGKDSSN